MRVWMIMSLWTLKFSVDQANVMSMRAYFDRIKLVWILHWNNEKTIRSNNASPSNQSRSRPESPFSPSNSNRGQRTRSSSASKQNPQKIRNLIPLAKGQTPPNQDPICDPQGVDLHLSPEAINIGISLPKAIEKIGGENFTNCNFHPILQKKKKLAIGNSY